jgi:hypothetical protein
MNIRELSQPVTSKKLNENMARQLGYKLNLENFSDAQLEDARNKMRTEMSQFEVSESFDSVSTSPKYQKVRMLHDVINQEILEREAAMEESKGDGNLANNAKPYDKVTRGDVIAGRLGKDEKGGKDKNKKKAEESMDHNIYLGKLALKAKEHSVPSSWIADAIRRINLGESDQSELASELVLRYDLSENVANHIVYLQEGEEEKAKIIMSTKDMVDRITGWLDDVSAMKAEQFLQLIDSIREELGSDVAEQYSQAIRPALEEIYSSLEKTRGSLSSGLGIVSGQGGGEMMGTAPGETPPMPGTDLPSPEMGGEEMGGEMPGAEASPAGREMRESQYSRKLGMMLAQSKKK